jgi:hypothetical protein
MRPPKPISKRCPLYSWFAADKSRTQTVLADLTKIKRSNLSHYIRHGRPMGAARYQALSMATGVPERLLIEWGERHRPKSAA